MISLLVTQIRRRFQGFCFQLCGTPVRSGPICARRPFVEYASDISTRDSTHAEAIKKVLRELRKRGSELFF